jgi:hypothetical protein
MGGVGGDMTGAIESAFRALAHLARQIVHIIPQRVELLVEIVDVEVFDVLDELRGLALGVAAPRS